MKSLLVSLVSLCAMTGMAYSQSSVPPSLLVGSFEMLSNGNGPVGVLAGFDVTTPTVGGAYSADWYRDVLQSPNTPPTIQLLPDGMQAAGGWYFVVAGGPGITDYETAANRWTRNGTHNARVAGNTYEIRFTPTGGKAIYFSSNAFVDVPFELWSLADTPGDATDDVRMIPWLVDNEGIFGIGDPVNIDVFSFALDHEADADNDDPFSDWIYFRMPADDSPGQAGYDQFAFSGDIAGSVEHIGRLVLMNWDRHQQESAPGAADGPVNALPESGTTFRLSFTTPGAVALDVKPGSDPNTINCDKLNGIVPVAVLTTDDFDAATVDPSSATFGPHGALEVHGAAHLDDVEGDGDADMVFHFDLGETGISCADEDVTLLAETLSGETIFGFDTIQPAASMPDCGLADAAEHDYNQVRLLVDVAGNLGITPGRNAHFFFPEASCNQYVFAAGLMIGGMVGGTPTVAEATFFSEFAPSEVGATGEPFRVFNSTVPGDRQAWPPEFSDSRGNPLLVQNAQNLVVQYNDVEGFPVRDVPTPLGIEIRQRSLAFKGTPKRNTVILVWEITNISSDDIDDAYFGFWADHDIGDFQDDRGSVVNDMAVIWDDDFSEASFSEQAALMGFDFLETPGDAGFASFSLAGSGLPNDQTTDGVQYDFLRGAIASEVGGVIGDIRFVVSTGPFDLPAESSTLVAGAILFGRAPGGTTSLGVDPAPPFRPDPNDPILADLINTRQEVRAFYDRKLRGAGLPKRSEAPTQTALTEMPSRFALYQNHPNPFNPTTAISFDVPEARPVLLTVYDVMGRRVATLVDGLLPPGRHTVQWDAATLPTGVYFYRITAGNFVAVRQMLLIK